MTLVEQINGSGSGFGVWTAEGAIVFGSTISGLRRVSAEGGAVTDLTTLDAANRELYHNFPVLTPSGRAVLFSVRSGSVTFRTDAVMLDTGARRVVVENARALLVLSSGHLAFERDGAILVAPFDLDGLAVTGPAVPLVDAVRRSATSVIPTPTAELAASRRGTLAYVPATDAASALVLVRPDGTFEALGPLVNDYAFPRVSPDGNAIAFLVPRGQDVDVQLYDRLRGSTTKLTQGGASLSLGRPTALFDQSVPGGSGAAERYAQSNNVGAAYDVLPDGRFVMARGADPSGSREFVLVQHWFEELKRLVPVP